MKKLLLLTSVIVCALSLSSPASALLTRIDVDGSFVVSDDVNDLLWADIYRFGGFNYYNIIDEITAMNDASFAGSNTWHLASLTETTLLFESIITVGDARLFAPFSYLGGRYDYVQVPNSHTIADMDWANGESDDSTNFEYRRLIGTSYNFDYSQDNMGAFVVSSATMQPVPEPATIILLGTGLLGLIGTLRRKFRK